MYTDTFILTFYKLFSIFFLVSPISSILNSRSAVCFLTQQPSFETLKFSRELAQDVSSIDVFISVDNNSWIIPSTTLPNLRFLQINESICNKYHFKESGSFGSGKTCLAWDKALYYFSKHTTHHSFVWFLEEDVFIPSIQAFLALHDLYSSSHDLITSAIEYNINGDLSSWFHWYLAPGTFALPWAHSMVCAVGCSRRLLSAVNEYVKWRGHLTFVEFLFHTLAIQNNMKIINPFELDTISYRRKYTYENIKARPNNWWHPVKNLTQHAEWRHW